MATTKLKRLNCRIIESNLTEAAAELERLRSLASKARLTEDELQIGLRHAYHHLNFAWNIRYVPTAQYRRMTDLLFERWGRYPSEIEKLD
jgi:hypothetical protein